MEEFVRYRFIAAFQRNNGPREQTLARVCLPADWQDRQIDDALDDWWADEFLSAHPDVTNLLWLDAVLVVGSHHPHLDLHCNWQREAEILDDD